MSFILVYKDTEVSNAGQFEIAYRVLEILQIVIAELEFGNMEGHNNPGHCSICEIMGIHHVLRRHVILLFDNHKSIFNATKRMFSQEESHNYEYVEILELVTQQKHKIVNLKAECRVLQQMVTNLAKISQ
jgi:hypothetical protein